jgi:hypothetical protein
MRCVAVHSAFLGLFFIVSTANAQVAYTITNIIDTTSQFANFGHFLSADDGAPVLNSSGTVGFWAQLDTGPQGFFTLNGTTVTTIADSSSTFTDFSPRRPAMNSNGRVTFFAQTTTGPGIFAGNGGGNPAVTTIANTTTPYPGQPNPFGGFANRPSINNAGTVAFTGSSGPASGVFTGTGGGVTLLATIGINAASGATSINTGGMVAVHGNTADPVDFQRIWATNGGPLNTLASPLGSPLANGLSPPSFNSSGTAVFAALLDGGGEGIFTSNGGAPVPIATTADGFAMFFDSPTINGGGDVFFQAVRPGNLTGIFFGSDPMSDRLISVGDPLFGSTVTAVNIGSFGLNDLGQLAFFYNLADGRNGLALATPVPEPTSFVLLASIVGGAAVIRRQKSQRAQRN